MIDLRLFIFTSNIYCSPRILYLSIHFELLVTITVEVKTTCFRQFYLEIVCTRWYLIESLSIREVRKHVSSLFEGMSMVWNDPESRGSDRACRALARGTNYCDEIIRD